MTDPPGRGRAARANGGSRIDLEFVEARTGSQETNNLVHRAFLIRPFIRAATAGTARTLSHFFECLTNRQVVRHLQAAAAVRWLTSASRRCVRRRAEE